MTRMTNSNPMSLSNVGKGEVIRRFDDAMTAALTNIKDPSTPAKKNRKILIEATIVPSPDRDGGDLSIVVLTKLATSEPYASQVIISENIDGNLIAHESVSVGKFDESALQTELDLDGI